MSSECTVLHVDDDQSVLDVSSDWADVRDELEWLTASDPGAGLELLSANDVDCLVSDSFRAADGTPFVIRAATTFPDLPVVLFTSLDRDSLDPAVRRAGAEYVKKGATDPFESLFDRVRTVAADANQSPSTVDRAPVPASRPTTRDDSEATERWTPIGRYRPAEGDDLATAIVTALEAYTDRDETDFPPLYDAIDAEALAALLDRPNGQLRNHVQVRFVYADHELAVTGDGFVLVRTA